MSTETEGTTTSGSNGAPSTPSEETMTLTTTQLNERMERARRALVKKELGVEDLEAAKAKLARLAELEKGEEDRKKAAMSEQERLQAELQTAKNEAANATADAERARLDLHLTRLFARHGVRNTDYATYRIMAKLNELPETEDLDEDAFVKELLASPSERVALGLDAPAAPPEPRKVEVPPTTTVPAGTAPKPPAANPVQPPKTAMDMTPAEWAKHKAALGIP